jgi:DNA-binding IclR family transcriptional regulator
MNTEGQVLYKDLIEREREQILELIRNRGEEGMFYQEIVEQVGIPIRYARKNIVFLREKGVVRTKHHLKDTRYLKIYPVEQKYSKNLKWNR